MKRLILILGLMAGSQAVAQSEAWWDEWHELTKRQHELLLEEERRTMEWMKEMDRQFEKDMEDMELLLQRLERFYDNMDDYYEQPEDSERWWGDDPKDIEPAPDIDA